MADTDLTPYDMGTFGSRTTPTMAPELRKAARAAREALAGIAAAKWSVARTAVQVADGKASCEGHPAGFGELTRGQKMVESIGPELPLTPATDWQVAGHSVPKVDARELVTGKHHYTPDMKRPGMLHGKVLRPAAFGAKLVSFDDSTARQIPGVTVVREGDFAAVAAPDAESAGRALAALKAEWKSEPQPSDRDLFTYLKANAEPGEDLQGRGSIERGLA